MSNLWPSDIFDADEITTPIEILQQQASFLGELTKNVLKGTVDQIETRRAQIPFQYSFYITAPTIGNYSYRLFIIQHDIDLYPVYLIPDEEIAKELLGESYKSDSRIKYPDEESFKSALKSIFRSAKTKKVINALLQMTRGKLAPPPTDDLPF